ncbi:MAG: TOBE domain-containing protein [Alphaproteobacteria bacterium]|nr:TOBE domain-containing protein [Alphaproteobacteria bacterium]
MRLELKQLRSRMRTTSIYVTHDQVEAMTLGDRVVVMRDGVIQQTGRPNEIYGAPANIFVAGFIGSPAMNFIRALLIAEGDDLYATAPGIRLRAPDFLRNSPILKAGKGVSLGIRPEFISVQQPNSAAGGDNAGHVDIVDQMGAEIILQVRIGETVLAVSRVDPDSPIAVGDRVILTPNPQKLHFFDVDSGAAIVR